MKEIIVTKESFEKEVLASDRPVLVDFYADWCGPCKMIAPVLAEIAEEYGDKVKVCKVNVDKESGLAGSYGVVSIPTILVVEKGQVKEKAVGFRTKSHLLAMLGI